MCNKNLPGDAIANVNFLRRHRTCRAQHLRPLNRVPDFYYNCLCWSMHIIIYAPTPIKPSYQSLFCPN